VFTIIADNGTVNDVAIDYMTRKLKDKRDSILEGEFLHMQCAAHILNLGLEHLLCFVVDMIIIIWS
jgi:hypothetical protein